MAKKEVKPQAEEIGFKFIGQNIIVVIDNEKYSKKVIEKEDREKIKNKITLFNKQNSDSRKKDIIKIFTKKTEEKEKKESVKKGIKKQIKKVTKESKKQNKEIEQFVEEKRSALDLLKEKKEKGELTDEDRKKIRALLDIYEKIDKKEETIIPAQIHSVRRSGEH